MLFSVMFCGDESLRGPLGIDRRHTSVGGDIGRNTKVFCARAVSIDISATAGLVVRGTVSAVGVAYFEGVFHRGLHWSVFMSMGPTVTVIWR